MAWCWSWMEDPRIDIETRQRINREIGVGTEPDVRVRHRRFRTLCRKKRYSQNTDSASNNSLNKSPMILSRFIRGKELMDLLWYDDAITDLEKGHDNLEFIWSKAEIGKDGLAVFAVVEQTEGSTNYTTRGMSVNDAGVRLGCPHLLEYPGDVAKITYRVSFETARPPNSIDAKGWPNFCPTNENNKFGRTRDLRDDSKALQEVVTTKRILKIDMQSLEQVGEGEIPTPTPNQLQWIRSRQDRWSVRNITN